MILTTARRVAGAVSVTVGLVGLALCLFLIIQIGGTAYRISQQTPAVVAQLETVIDGVQQRGADASSVVHATRDRLQWVRATVDELPSDDGDRRLPPALATVNVEIVASLERAETFVRAMQTNLETASNALLLLESIPFLGATLSPPASGSERGSLRHLAAGLTDVSAALSQGAGLLAELRLGGGVDAAQLARLQEALQQVDDQLVQIQAETERFNAAVSTMDARLEETANMIQQRIRLIAAFGITFFTCFGFSQLQLIAQGWQSMRGRTFRRTSGE